MSNELLQILTDVPSTSSGSGCSYYSTRCARQVVLDKIQPRESSFKARVGTVFHKICELYYSGALQNVVLPIDDNADFDSDAVQEAMRVFAAYCMYFPQNEFTILANEQLFPRPVIYTSGEGTTYNLDAEVMARVAGVDPFSMRLDMVVEVNETQSKGFHERRGMEITPGRYIYDFKTASQKDSNVVWKYNEGPQFIMYPAIYNALFPATPVLGTIVGQIIRHSDLHQREKNGLLRSFPTHVVPLPSGNKVLAYQMHFARKLIELQSGLPNLDACFDWGVCGHLTSGLCTRI